MHSLKDIAMLFEQHFNKRHFPQAPKNLYDAAEYILQIGGKRIRPLSVLMANEVFGPIHEDAYQIAEAIELFHNFTLVHDDIMDKAPLRRGVDTVHIKYGSSTALLAGDVMLVAAYERLNLTQKENLPSILSIFNKTAREVCEGQQMDMDFEHRDDVTLEDYLHMIKLKTSVLLAGCMQMGALVGGANEEQQQHLYQFGLHLGIAFQIQDDYLDAFGDPATFGKQVGGDILANKKTFLLIHALEVAQGKDKQELQHWLATHEQEGKVEAVLNIYRNCKVDEWAAQLKMDYMNSAIDHLNDVTDVDERKSTMKNLAEYLLNRTV
jgi:geranylgeranyl diphosphate synthase type II